MIFKDPFTEEDEQKFLAWIRTQRSCLSGKSPCEACHVRSVEHGSGTGRKPRLFAVPMTQEEHRTQTNHGYLEAIIQHKRPSFAEIWLGDFSDDKRGLQWFKEKAMEYRNRFLSLKDEDKIVDFYS